MNKRQAAIISLAFLLAACHAAQTLPPAENSSLPKTAVQENQTTAEKTENNLPIVEEKETEAVPPSVSQTPKIEVKKEIEPAATQEITFPSEPAADRAIFDGEDLIDFSERSLHPYAGLVPLTKPLGPMSSLNTAFITPLSKRVPPILKTAAWSACMGGLCIFCKLPLFPHP